MIARSPPIRRDRSPLIPHQELHLAYVGVMWPELDWLDDADDSALEELTGAEDADELCRRLLESPWGWGSSTRHGEAVELLHAMQGTGTLPDALVALLVCTCRRWDRVTAKLIAAVEAAEMLSDSDLDELAESFLGEEVVIEYPFLWVCPQGLEMDCSDESARAVTADEHTVAQARRRPEPPLRRWAAGRALHNDPRRLDELSAGAEVLLPRHRGAMLHGLLDAADGLQPADRRRLAQRGLRNGQARVRRGALDMLCELDGPEPARRRARSDPDRTVRAWSERAPLASYDAGPGQR